MKKITMLTIATVLSTTVLVTGCSQSSSVDWTHSPNKTALSPLRLDESVSRNDLAKARSLAKMPYSFELVRFHDRRTPQERSSMVEEGVIYEYTPDQLMRGVESYMGSSLKRFLTFGPQKEEVFKMEYELRRLRTYIGSGSFVSGMFGKYRAIMEVDVIARDEDSRVIFKDTVKLEADESRRSDAGRHPSAQKDSQEMEGLIRRLTRKLAIHSAWKVRKIAGNHRKPYVNYDEQVWENSYGDY